MKYPKLVIFDCDGVISHTAHLHYKAWSKVAKKYWNIKLENSFLDKFRGLSRKDSLELILNSTETKIILSNEIKEKIINEKNVLYLKFLNNKKNIKVYPSTIKFIKNVREKNILTAVASTSINSEFILKQANIFYLFDYLVDPREIINHKPNPDIFLKAANHLKINVEDCWALEDAKVGIEAILSANMFAIGVGSDQEVGNSHIRFSNTKEINFEKILEKYNKKSW